MKFVPLTQAVAAGGEMISDDAVSRQGYLIRRLRWQLPKLLSTHFLMPVFKYLVPDEMNSIAFPDDGVGVIGIFNPDDLIQGDLWEPDTTLYHFLKKTTSQENPVFYDFMNPYDYQDQVSLKGIHFFQRENRIFFDASAIEFTKSDIQNRGVAILYTRLPKDDRGYLVPDFMVECLAALVEFQIMQRRLNEAIFDSQKTKGIANVPQIRMHVKELNFIYKTRAKQAMVAQQEYINGREIIPISYQN